MEISPFSSWRWVVRALGRNPLVRASDRAEAFVTLLAAVMALLGALAAGALGTAAYDAYLTPALPQHHDAAASTVIVVAAASTARLQRVRTSPTAAARRPHAGFGDELLVWAGVDLPSSGPGTGDALVAAGWVGTLTASVVLAVATALLAAARQYLDRRRDILWDRALGSFDGLDGNRRSNH